MLVTGPDRSAIVGSFICSLTRSFVRSLACSIIPCPEKCMYMYGSHSLFSFVQRCYVEFYVSELSGFEKYLFVLIFIPNCTRKNRVITSTSINFFYDVHSRAQIFRMRQLQKSDRSDICTFAPSPLRPFAPSPLRDVLLRP